MDFINPISAGSLNDAIGKFIYNVLYGWISGWSKNWGVVGAFSVTVIMFTLFLKILVLPFDFWQKQLARNNAKKMEIMRPRLEKITKECGNNKELLMQKQRELYKKHKYSVFGSCLPMIITLAIFFVVFGGFNSAVKMHNTKIYERLEEVYDETYYSVIDSEGVKELSPEEISAKREEAVKKAEDAVVENYRPERFLLTKNIFVADDWKNPIPSAKEFTGGGMGGSGIAVDPGKYEVVMRPLIKEYEKTWNGYLILPVLVLALNLLTMKLTRPPEQPEIAGQSAEQAKAQQAQMKMMQFLMPVMMLVFALFYSTAFTLYMFVNTFLTTIFNLIFNAVTKSKDAKEKDRVLSTTFKK